MPRYEYEVEWTPDGSEPEPEVVDQSRTRARPVKSVMHSSVEAPNEAQALAHMRKSLKRAGNWQMRFRVNDGSGDGPPEWSAGPRVRTDREGKEIPE